MKEYVLHTTQHDIEANKIMSSYAELRWRVHTFTTTLLTFGEYAGNIVYTILFERDVVENSAELLQEGATVNITRYGDFSDNGYLT